MGNNTSEPYQEALKRIEQAAREKSAALDLSDLALTALPPEIGRLGGLKELHLYRNQLTTLPPEIGRLVGLTVLHLGGNQLTTLPPEIGQLVGLTVLHLGINPLTMLPPEIGRLVGLRSLYLFDNLLTMLPPEIGLLAGLQELYLFDNLLTMLPPEIGRLGGLQVLGLGDNQLTTLPPEVVRLVGLKELGLGVNQLTTLPPEIGGLVGLQKLFLHRNRLTTLPPEIGRLDGLQVLNLGGNQLTTLPPEMAKLTALKALFLHDNPRLGLPPEVLGPTFGEIKPFGEKDPADPAAILAYYLSLAGGARPLREIKLILVGRGEVGKTTLADVLQGKPFEKSRGRTDGINITPWTVRLKGGPATIRIWDFGGQEIMHGTHQFFLTKRAIYVVMVDGRDDRYQREAERWLKLVRAFGGDSTVLVVMNRQANCKFDLDRNGLISKYKLAPEHFFPTECSSKRTIKPLHTTVLRLADDLLSTQSKFPAKWWTVKTRIETMKEDFLSDAAYRELCSSSGIADSDEQDKLLDSLNDLGVVVHFSDDDGLAELKVLDPEWATDGVYRVVTNEKLREEKQGKLKARALRDILPKKRWPEASHRNYILRLMQRFDLCFPAEGEDDVYIVPDLLPDKTPNLDDWVADRCVVFRYRYPVLPHGILPRFISKTHLLSQGKPRWRSGVILEKDGAQALVRADYDEATVSVWVHGKHKDARRALLTIIREKFDGIHGRFKDLNPDQELGVPRHPTVFVPYQDLILDYREGKRTFRVTIGGQRADVVLEDILSGVESRDQSLEAIRRLTPLGGEGPRYITVNGDYNERKTEMRDINMRDNYGQVAETMMSCSNMVQRQGNGDTKALLEQLHNQVEQLIGKLPADKAGEAPQVAKNLEMLVEQATSERPNRRWYDLSAEGLMEASAWVKDFAGNIVGTVGQIGKLIWPDYRPPGKD